MKKLLLSLVFLVTGVAGVIPYWMGMVAEQQFEQFNLSFYPGVNLKLLEGHYERGWFNSQARAVFGTQNASESVSEEYHFTFVHNINHSPYASKLK
jgi:uncharacterized protein YdgA (DUF945 family)